LKGRKEMMTVKSRVGNEVFLPADELIVSKTDLKGRITYANNTFCKVSGYGVAELMGAPHSIVRHLDMPRAAFKLLWDTLAARREVFAYVKNRTKSGDCYWVFAHVTPSFAADGSVVGYHSTRRAPKRATVEGVVAPLYATVLEAEASCRNGKDALAAGVERLGRILADAKISYEEFVLTI
jgi:PAS domain S-box-containing protein